MAADAQISAFTCAEVVAILERRVIEAGSQRALARRLGVSVPYLNDVLRGRRDPGPAILAPLGLRVVVRYERRYELASPSARLLEGEPRG